MRRVRTLQLAGLALWACVLASAASAQTPEQAPVTTPPAAAFTPAQLEQMVAPIALYPDSLVTQILMAATYPLEIVEAARWTVKNPGLKPDALEAKLKEQDWDIAVKALCGFPDVLKRMNENLDWTQDLGDAFLAQQSDVLDTVQRMRGKAYEAGNLKTTEQQVVTQQPDKIIVIQPANPQVIYVPTYAPTVVYGAWAYPTYYYPPMYAPPPPGYGMMAFTAGVFWGAALSSNCNWGWGHSDVHINVNHYNNFNRNTNVNFNKTNIQNNIGGQTAWKHDPDHRGGVNYKNNQTAQKFGAQGGSNRVTRDQARGYDRATGAGGAAARNNQAASRPAAGRANAPATRNSTAQPRPSASATSAASRSPRSNPSASPSARSSASHNSTFSGSRNAGMDRSASSRGSMSRGGGGMGGGGYGGGGRMGGGGGGGGRSGGGRR